MCDVFQLWHCFNWCIRSATLSVDYNVDNEIIELLLLMNRRALNHILSYLLMPPRHRSTQMFTHTEREMSKNILLWKNKILWVTHSDLHSVRVVGELRLNSERKCVLARFSIELQ